jgi:hypothetical protein
MKPGAGSHLVHCGAIALTASLTLAAFAGCSSDAAGGSGGSVYKAVRDMGVLFNQFIVEHSGQPPKDEQEFRSFLATKQSVLEALNLSVDGMFVSPRNGTPITWVYGGKLPKGPQGMTYIAYEKAPVDGKRFVLAMNGMHAELDEAEFKRLFSAAT